MNLNELFNKNVDMAEKGRIFWNQLTDELGLGGQDVVLVLFGSDKECAEIVLKYGENLIKKGKNKRIFVLSDSRELLENAELMSWIGKCIYCGKEKLLQLKMLYRLYNFSRQVIFCTLHDMEDVDGSCMVEKYRLTMEELVVTIVLDLPFEMAVPSQGKG